jgi:hypothetical protein
VFGGVCGDLNIVNETWEFESGQMF